jgi:hypothetical protein
VPTTFTEPWRVAWDSDCPVPVSAAKWTIYVAELLDALRRALFSWIICRISL